MAGEDPTRTPTTAPTRTKPSLELPSIGLFRRRRKPTVETAAPNSPDSPVAAEFEREQVTGPLAEPRTAPPAAPAPDRLAPVGEGVPQDDETAREPTVVGGFEREVVTGPLADPRRRSGAQAEVVGVGQPQPAMTPTPMSDPPVAEPADRPGRPRSRVSMPPIGALPAALVTGVVVGLVTVGLTWLALRGCSGLRGTSTCGNAGLLLYLVVLIAMIYLGAALLRAWRVPDAGSTSFLGMALLAVVALVLSVTSLGGWLSTVVLAVVGAATYGAAHWVTASFTEPGERTR